MLQKIYRCQISIWKDIPHHLSSGKWKLKQQWDTTTHPLKWAKSRTPTPNAGEEEERQELSFIAGGNAKWYRYFGRQFGGFLQNENTLIIRSSNRAPWYLPKRVKNLHPGLPWWRSGRESACQCRGHGFGPWSGKIAHAAERLGPWATTTEPAGLEPVLRNNRGRDSGRPAHGDEEWPPLAATGEGPRTETKTQHSKKKQQQKKLTSTQKPACGCLQLYL